LQRRYAIRKDKIRDARQVLRPGYRAEGYANLYLFNPPIETQDATHVFLDCVFYGIKGVSEGGNGELHENLEKTEEIANIGIWWTYNMIIYRYFYTMRAGSKSRNLSRTIPQPPPIETRNIQGTLVTIGFYQFWQNHSVSRTNYGLYDSVIESWRYKILGT